MSGETILDRGQGAPLHHQLYLVLADAISSGRYAEGDALPTEEKLTELYGVSRITVRRAMASLHEQGSSTTSRPAALRPSACGGGPRPRSSAPCACAFRTGRPSGC